jgi:type IV pilus assembly protein PilV
MSKPLPSHRQKGVMLIEALIAILIFSIGILAVVGMQSVAVKSVTESKYRSEAALLAEELVAQMWVDQHIDGTGVNVSNITAANYTYPGSAPRLASWLVRVQKLPGTATYPPKVTLSNITPQGATVTIEIRWQLPEEASQTPTPPPHSYLAEVAIYV